MLCEIIPSYGHYEIYIDGEFYGSADTLSEAATEIDNYIEREVTLNRTTQHLEIEA